ncbi:MAG: Gfo/Idh/MocA family oxidoreductase [Candidatus Bathyarchaeota archaeon]|nr:Gfo/Idh/MocA family oxidoreductase [Candidatus Bathyarchaeota archaeon]
MEQLDVAVIGCGTWGYHHARVYSEIPGVRLEAVADLDPRRVQNVTERFHCKGYSSVERLLDEADVDAVSVCTPTVTHYEVASLALTARKHVLVEKPMTDNVAEAESLIKQARDYGVFLSVGFVERFNPAVQESKRTVDRGDIGEVLIIHTRRVTRRPSRIGDVGVVKDLGIHDVDVMNYIMGESPESVYARAGAHNHCFEDYANMVLGYSGMRSGFVETNWLTPKRVRTLTITGSEGIIDVEYTTQELRVEKDDHIYQPLNWYREPLYLELSDFTSAILEKRKPSVTGVDGVDALRVCEAALRSADTGRVMFLEEL